MSKYHNSPNGPRRCKAQDGENARGCPYANAGMPHFATQAEAQAAYESSMQEKFGNFEAVSVSTIENIRQNYYSTNDKFAAGVAMTKATAKQAKDVAMVKTLATRDTVVGAAKTLRSKFAEKIAMVKANAQQFAANMEAMGIEQRAIDMQRKAERKERSAARRDRFAEMTRDSVQKVKKETAHQAFKAISSTRQTTASGARKIGEIQISKTKMGSQLQRGDRFPGGTVLATQVNGEDVQVRYMNKDGVVLTAKFKDAPVKTQRSVRSYANKIKKGIQKAPAAAKVASLHYTEAIRNNYREATLAVRAGVNAYKGERQSLRMKRNLNTYVAPPVSKKKVNNILMLAELRNTSVANQKYDAQNRKREHAFV